MQVDFSREGIKGSDQIDFFFFSLSCGMNAFDQIAGTVGREKCGRYLWICVVGRVKETMCNGEL